MANTNPTDRHSENTSQTGENGGIKETIKTVIIAVAVAMVIRTFAFEPFNIPSGSMKPTLLVGDYLFVSKFSYGYSRYSLPFGLPLIPNRILFSEPERGDVAVFKLPTDTSTDYIKRIIGLPGDKVQVVKGVLHINGVSVQRRRVGNFLDKDERARRYQQIPQYIETLPGGRKHLILEYTDENPFDISKSDTTRVFTVPIGHYFVMGDNRDRSQDSRFLNAVGFIPRRNLVGRAEIKFFSVDGSALKFWNWPWSLRLDRFFDGIK